MKNCGPGIILLLILLTDTQLAFGRRQFCGSDLADVMKLVCDGRGYNVAYRSDFNLSERRFKRGIVDECCRRACSWSTLEIYCSPTPRKIQLRKRSYFPSKSQPETEVKNLNYVLGYKANPEQQAKISLDSGRSNSHLSMREEDKLEKQLKNYINKDDENHPSKSASQSFTSSQQRSGLTSNNERGVIQPEPSADVQKKIDKPEVDREYIRRLSSQIGTVSPYFINRNLINL